MPSTINSRFQPEKPMQNGELFSLKVMRFPQPYLKTNTNIMGKERGGITIAEYKAVPGDTYFKPSAISGSLGLVTDAKDIYMGENSTMCVIVSQNSESIVSNVGVRIEIQTETSRQIVVDSLQTSQDLRPGQTIDFMFEFRLSEAGDNALVCCVFYKDDDGLSRNFQKFFRFFVEEPLSVDMKMIEKQRQKLAQVAITNLAQEPMMIESLKFQSQKGVKAVPLNDLGHSLYSEGMCRIKSQAIHNFSFKLLIDKSKLEGDNESKGKQLGYLEVKWRRSGHFGELHTRPLTDTPVNKNLRASLTILEAPSRVVLETVFYVTVEIECRSTKPIKLRLSMMNQKHLSVIPAGVADFPCGTMKYNEKKNFKIGMLALAVGIQRLSGLKLTSKEVGFSKEFDNLHHVCVVKKSAEEMKK
mmetsp:Transcript_23627/g.35450  ORF Transcript_23627/g.35450 Transcript_23627/m.35450 type:complete len:414 (+) Transcript_23627:66-1307(+)